MSPLCSKSRGSVLVLRGVHSGRPPLPEQTSLLFIENIFRITFLVVDIVCRFRGNSRRHFYQLISEILKGVKHFGGNLWL